MRASWAVLVVEDNPAESYLVERAFEEAETGAKILEARDGMEAIMMLDAATPDMVLLDLGLPDFHGLDLLTLFKAVPARCPIVVMTGSSAERDRAAALARGAEQFVTKPSSFQELVRIVKELALRFRPRPE